MVFVESGKSRSANENTDPSQTQFHVPFLELINFFQISARTGPGFLFNQGPVERRVSFTKSIDVTFRIHNLLLKSYKVRVFP